MAAGVCDLPAVVVVTGSKWRRRSLQEQNRSCGPSGGRPVKCYTAKTPKPNGFALNQAPKSCS